MPLEILNRVQKCVLECYYLESVITSYLYFELKLNECACNPFQTQTQSVILLQTSAVSGTSKICVVSGQ